MSRRQSSLSVPFTLDVPVELHLAPSSDELPLVLVLHGQGMRPESFARHYGALLDLPVHVAFARGIYPLEVTGRAGPQPRRIGFGWYTYDGDQEHFAAELDRGTAHLARTLDAIEASHSIDRSRIAMVGFSQGGYLAYVASLRLASRLAAFVGLAARLKEEAVTDELKQLEHRFPVLHVHGRSDEGVPFADGEATVAALQRHGWEAALHAYDGGHLVPRSEVSIIRDWLARALQVEVSADPG